MFLVYDMSAKLEKVTDLTSFKQVLRQGKDISERKIKIKERFNDNRFRAKRVRKGTSEGIKDGFRWLHGAPTKSLLALEN